MEIMELKISYGLHLFGGLPNPTHQYASGGGGALNYIMGISIVRERLRDQAHNGWDPGGGAPGSSVVLYILVIVQFDGLILFVIGTVQSL